MTIPFSQPYTAPDGTTRRSLWEREPGTRHPDLERKGGYFANDWSIRGMKPHLDGRGDGGIDEIPESVASALARVAAEDWLFGMDWCIFVSTNSALDRYFEVGSVGGTRATIGGYVHVVHALNAAAHAVLDAKGVER